MATYARPLRSPVFARAVPACIALVLSLAGAAVRADEVKIAGTGAALGTMRLLAEAYAAKHAGHTYTVLPSMGSSGGIKALLSGAVQIAVSARAPKDNETQAGAQAFEYGRTPFVFAVPSATKGQPLNAQVLADIYAGTLSQWPDGSRIRVVMRPVGDSDTELIKGISPALRDAKNAAEQRKGMLFTVTDQDTADAVEKTPGGLGPTTLALMLSEKRALKALPFNGVMPEPRTLADGTYPLAKSLYIVTGAKPSAAVQGFVDFVRSPAGRQILMQTGHWVK